MNWPCLGAMVVLVLVAGCSAQPSTVQVPSEAQIRAGQQAQADAQAAADDARVRAAAEEARAFEESAKKKRKQEVMSELSQIARKATEDLKSGSFELAAMEYQSLMADYQISKAAGQYFVPKEQVTAWRDELAADFQTALGERLKSAREQCQKGRLAPRVVTELVEKLGTPDHRAQWQKAVGEIEQHWRRQEACIVWHEGEATFLDTIVNGLRLKAGEMPIVPASYLTSDSPESGRIRIKYSESVTKQSYSDFFPAPNLKPILARAQITLNIRSLRGSSNWDGVWSLEGSGGKLPDEITAGQFESVMYRAVGSIVTDIQIALRERPALVVKD